MKNSIRFIFGLLLLIPIGFASSATGAPHKGQKPDTYQYGFGYTVVVDPSNPNVYDETLYCLQLDVTNFTWTVVDCPAAIAITCTYGPKIGTFTFPAGWSSVPIGNSTTIPGTEYTISTNPTTLNGLSVYQEAFEITL
ncbi:hypothetical protein [Dinghuibacter silviterrae]|uniref:Uncharacterized protein n=1 Tax=Dinghuibacter silviterrae TaxID=1539049 RepID=A0A4R8DUD9_9BACT|nr:hypothetical protein [Dinghuibacter silviterrae]TDX01536.1 hypothetical protein EDB95_2576 [Dinghuibacter silviterrae]